MTDRKTEELSENELDQVAGGASIGDLKPGLTSKAGKRVNDKLGIRANERVGIRAKRVGKRFSTTAGGDPNV